MRDVLAAAFREAHAQVAGVIRELQRGGSARAAAVARAELQRIEATTPSRAAGDALPANAAADADAVLAPVDWRRAPGDPVRIAGAAQACCARCRTAAGGSPSRSAARVLVPAERVGLADMTPRRSPRVQPHAARGGSAGAYRLVRPRAPRGRSDGPPRRG
jgi:hypothetical protein